VEANLNMPRRGKISLAVVRIVQIILLFSIFGSVLIAIMPSGISFFGPPVDKTTDFWFTTISNELTSIIFLFILFLSAKFLQTLKKKTPFLHKNVKRLKIISILLIAVEPVQFLLQKIGNFVRPSIDGTKEVIFTSFGGIILAMGLVVFCLALVFEYGVELQKQSDETL
jgi:hypothetical protein